jgi:hypothetical protein
MPGTKIVDKKRKNLRGNIVMAYGRIFQKFQRGQSYRVDECHLLSLS